MKKSTLKNHNLWPLNFLKFFNLKKTKQTKIKMASKKQPPTDAIDRFLPQVTKKNPGSIIDVEELVENGRSDLDFVKIVSVQDLWQKDWKIGMVFILFHLFFFLI